jgi:ABC-2 type transport system ATP-binding protein
MGKEKTVLLSTHIMQEVEAMCSRVVIIRKGNVVANAPVKELTASDQKLEQIFKELTTK